MTGVQTCALPIFSKTSTRKNKKVFKGLDFKKGDKVYLFTKKFKSKWLSKKLNYIKIGLFKIINKVIKISYRLDLLLKMKIYLVYYTVILKLVYRDYKSLVYKYEIYRS